MNVYKLYQLINIVARKDRNGLLSPEDYNVLLPAETRNYVDYLLRYYKRDTKTLEQFEPLIGESTSVSVPILFSSRVRFAMEREVRAKDGSIIPILDYGSWYDYQNSFIKKPSESNPIARKLSGKIEIAPGSISKADITYIRYPEDPYMDGYVDGSDNFNFLEAGETITLASDETALNGDTNISHDSQTVELPFDDEGQIEIAIRILGDMGVAYNKASLIQYANQMKAED